MNEGGEKRWPIARAPDLGTSAPLEVEREREPEESWIYASGEVIEQNVNDAPLRYVVVGTGRKKEMLKEGDLPSLRDQKVGDIVVVERRAGVEKKASIIEDLGKAGTLAAERGKLAYSIGNGRIFPPPVRQEVEQLAAQPEKFVAEELDRVEKGGGLISAIQENYQEAYKHRESRVDFRDILTMTIDPKSAKDFDDALSARTVSVGGKEYIEVGVHIADVSHFLPMKKGVLGHEMYEEAKKREFTAYLEGEAFPMLPAVLSEKLCSLEEGKDRLAFSTVFRIDPADKKIVHAWHGKTVIRSGKRFAYEEAEALRTTESPVSGAEGVMRTALQQLTEYGQILRKERTERGAITSFKSREEPETVYGPSGEILSMGPKKEFEMNRVVADWMIRANEAMASTITEKSKQSAAIGGDFPTFLRAHEPPSLKELREIAVEFGARKIVSSIDRYEKREAKGNAPKPAPDAPSFEGEVVNHLFEYGAALSRRRANNTREGVTSAIRESRPHPLIGKTEEETRENIQRRLNETRDDKGALIHEEVMELFPRAFYTTRPEAHFGLSASPYTHGTSPIRRFPDVIVHHLLDAALSGGPVSHFNEASVAELNAIAAQANERQRIVKRAQGDSLRMWGAELLSHAVGSEMRVRVGDILNRGRGGTRLVFVQIPLPKGGFPVSFRIPIPKFRGFPRHLKEQDALKDTEIPVRLLGTNLAEGTVELQYLGPLALKPARDERTPQTEPEAVVQAAAEPEIAREPQPITEPVVMPQIESPTETREEVRAPELPEGERLRKELATKVLAALRRRLAAAEN